LAYIRALSMNCLYNRPIIFIINNIGLKMSDSIEPQKENRLMALINKVPFILQVVSGMVLGVIFAIILPNGQPVITMLGDLFVDALKAIAPFLVLALVMSSIALQKKGIDAKVKPIILLFVVSMLGATFVSLILTDIFPSTFAVLADKVEATPPQNLASVLTSVIRRAVDNPASALVNGNYIAILFWGIVFGVI
jgi:serine/threonine transporter